MRAHIYRAQSANDSVPLLVEKISRKQSEVLIVIELIFDHSFAETEETVVWIFTLRLKLSWSVLNGILTIDSLKQIVLLKDVTWLENQRTWRIWRTRGKGSKLKIMEGSNLFYIHDTDDWIICISGSKLSESDVIKKYIIFIYFVRRICILARLLNFQRKILQQTLSATKFNLTAVA